MHLSWFLVAAVAGASPITPDDLWAVKRIGSPSVSPDGSRCVVEVTSFDAAKDESTSDLWLLATDGSGQKRLTTSIGKDSGPVWSPDGQAIAFVAKRGTDDVAQIYLIAPDGGEARRLSRLPMPPSGLKWSADSRTVFAIGWTWPDAASDADHKAHEQRDKDSKSKAAVIDAAQFRYWDRWLTDGKRPYVFAVNAATGAHVNLMAGCGRHLPPTEPSASDYDVSPDGKELCFVSDNVADPGMDANYDLFTLPIGGQAEAKLLTADNAAFDGMPAYSPDGRSIAFVRQTIKYFYADRARLMVRSGNTVKVLADDTDRSLSSPKWLPDGRRIAVEIEDAGAVGVGFVDTQTGRLAFAREPVTERAIDFGRTARVGVYLRSSFDHPSRVYAHRPGKQPVRIDTFNGELTSKWKLGRVESVEIKGADDKPVQMWVVYPPDFDAKKKWPLVQVVHGGPHNAITSDFSFRWNPHVWAGRGWVIGIVNFHGSSGFGQAFTDSITGDLGTKPLADVMRATDWLEQQPWIDRDRIATAGASYGGYMMAWMNGHTDRFKAMVCHAGVYNWHSMVASDFVRGRERSLGAPPWGDLERIDRQNPQRLAKNFKTPTLVLHGEKDYRVPITQGLEYYNTLRQKGVPSRFVYFPDENHWILKPQNSLIWHREVFGWLEKYIGRGPGNK